ncbi:MAG: hypothetical protein RPU15_08810 [Candidatus Sedimenticola sp. (ex Thyasira tokunagai)]
MVDFGITCKCGHTDEIDEFMKTPSGIDLLPGNYQCPSCGVAWTLKLVGHAQVFSDGYVIPARREIVEINRTL